MREGFFWPGLAGTGQASVFANALKIKGVSGTRKRTILTPAFYVLIPSMDSQTTSGSPLLRRSHGL